MNPSIVVSADRLLLDRAFIHEFLTESYWAKGRTRTESDILIDSSLNFGIYLGTKQIGYARSLTDTVQFAYVMDVFITPDHRGKGFSKKLVSFILEHEKMRDVKTIRLATADAHGLYEQFGFKLIRHPEKMMELVK